ncbi:MAG: 2-phosphosulfolactate phosphatase [Bacteroidetes bacterium]|nr:2-phosphosulfolactate phosphatase [Bacteroidota bacterium]
MNPFDQHEFDIRLEWGIKGVEMLAPISDVIIIVDVLSFSTSVDVAISQGAVVYPYRYRDDSSKSYAAQMGALLAGGRREGDSVYSLSPASLLSLHSGTQLVLPSPNGSTLSLATGDTKTICGCLRNAKAVADAAMRMGRKISIIPAGEIWPDSSLRPALEDMIGAGAIISYLKGRLSPESIAALSVFNDCKDIYEQISRSSSGKELIAMGFEEDVRIASKYNVSDSLPVLLKGAYTKLIS